MLVRARPARAARLHLARVEAAVNKGAPLLWAIAAARLDRWLRRTLARIRPQVENLIVVRAVHSTDPEVLYIAGLIQAAGADGEDRDVPEELAAAVEFIPADVSFAAGFLPRDPRRATITQHTRQLLGGDLGDYWRTLTDPTTLARRISSLRAKDVGWQRMVNTIASEYRADYWSAERLLRTTYNSAANFAHREDLVRSGYTHVKWLTAHDARVRRPGKRSRFDHVHMDGVTVPIVEPFVTPAGSRLWYPGDRSLGAPKGEVINCRCTIIGASIRP